MNIRARMAQNTAGLKQVNEYAREEAVEQRKTTAPKTGPGMAAQLAAAQLRVRELESKTGQLTLAVSDISPNPWQPRRVFPEAKLLELTESIREVGLIQPIVVRRVGEAYQIIGGERRWRAHKMLERTEIKATVIDCPDQDMAVLAVAENLDRDALQDYEVALAVRNVQDQFPDRKRLAEAFGLSRTGLYQFLAFHELPDFIKKDLDLQPSLLGSNAAERLVTVLKKYGEPAVAAARELWPDVANGALMQGKFAPSVAALATKPPSAPQARERVIEKFFAGKEHAGSITKDVDSFTVKIKSSSLTDVQELKIRQLIAELYGETSN